MLCFVDESGDTGLALGQGSSEYFTITAVVFEDDEDAHACDAAITALRQKRGLKAAFEFHFAETPTGIKKLFFETVCEFPFFYFAFTINKRAIYGDGFKHKDTFYKFTSKLLFEKAKPYLDNAVIVFDGRGSRLFKLQFETYLRKKINDSDRHRIRKVKLQDSKKNNLVQLADMVCGAVVQQLSKHSKEQLQFYEFVRSHEFHKEFWPKKPDPLKKEKYMEARRMRGRGKK